MLAVVALIALLGASRVEAAEVPAELGLLVILKVLTYDAGFESRVGDGEFLVLVPFAPSQADAAKNLVATAAGMPTRSMLGRTLRFEAIPAADLEAQLVARRAAAVLVPTGTPFDVARQQGAIATRHSRYGITLDEELVKAGITVGVALNGGKAQVILNITTARAIKAEFSAAVMRVARIQQ